MILQVVVSFRDSPVLFLYILHNVRRFIRNAAADRNPVDGDADFSRQSLAFPFKPDAD